MALRELCPRCESDKFKKNGHIHNGKQNHLCHDCGRQFVDCFEQSLISDETRDLIERLLLERLSLRGICRAVGLDSSGSWAFSYNALKICRIILTCRP